MQLLRYFFGEYLSILLRIFRETTEMASLSGTLTKFRNGCLRKGNVERYRYINLPYYILDFAAVTTDLIRDIFFPFWVGVQLRPILGAKRSCCTTPG